MWLQQLLGGTPDKKDKKKEGHEVYTAADSAAILSQQKWLSEKMNFDDDDLDSPHASQDGGSGEAAPAAAKAPTLQQQLAERDATIAALVMENLIVLRVLGVEVEMADDGLTRLSSRVSTLEASEAETTQIMGATFQKDAQQRLELKQAKAKLKEKEAELATLQSELAAARLETHKANARINELEDGHMASIIDNADDDDDMPGRHSKHTLTGVEYGASALHCPGSRLSGVAGSGGVNLAGSKGSPSSTNGGTHSPQSNLEVDLSGINANGDGSSPPPKPGRVASPTNGVNGVPEARTSEAGGCCVIS